MRDKIIEIISDVIKMEVDKIEADPMGIGLKLTPGWDSLAQLSIMTAIEDDFDIEMSIEEMEELDTAQKLIDRFL